VIEGVGASAQTIGRIYFGAGIRRDEWMWALYGWGSRHAPTLEAAKVELQQQHEERKDRGRR
jgi:hypothetical protein